MLAKIFFGDAPKVWIKNEKMASDHQNRFVQEKSSLQLTNHTEFLSGEYKWIKGQVCVGLD